MRAALIFSIFCTAIISPSSFRYRSSIEEQTRTYLELEHRILWALDPVEGFRLS